MIYYSGLLGRKYIISGGFLWMNKLLFLSVIIDCVNIECHNWNSFCENDECVVCVCVKLDIHIPSPTLQCGHA